MQNRDRLTISINKELIKDIEETRNNKTEHIRVSDNKSQFVEKILIIGLNAYKKKQKFFDTVNLNNIDLSKLNF